MFESISLNEARTIAIASQGLNPTNGDINTVFSKVKCIQFDPLRPIRESHELVCMSRGATIEEATSLLSNKSPICTFIYPAHALSLIPIKMWPFFNFFRKNIQNNGSKWLKADKKSIDEIRKRLRSQTLITSKEFKDKTGKGWDRSSALRVAAEWLLWTGEIVATTRQNLNKQYSLSENVIACDLLNQCPSDTECHDYLVLQAIDALGVATVNDIADYFRLNKTTVINTLKRLEIQKATVEGWEEHAWISNKAPTLAQLKLTNTIPLSPFDSLIWYRPRLNRLFSKTYTLEAYKPASKRSFGHYFVPILAGNKIIGRIAPRKINGQIQIEASEFEDSVKEKDKKNIIKLIQSWGN